MNAQEKHGCHGGDDATQAARMLTDEEIAVLSMQTWGCASIAPRLAPAFAHAAIEAFCRINNIKIGESNG